MGLRNLHPSQRALIEEQWEFVRPQPTSGLANLFRRGRANKGDKVTAETAVPGRLYKPDKATTASATAYKKTKLAGYSLRDKLRKKRELNTLSGQESFTLALLEKNSNLEVFERVADKPTRNPLLVVFKPDYALVEVVRVRDVAKEKAKRKEYEERKERALAIPDMTVVPLSKDEKKPAKKGKAEPKVRIGYDRLTGQKFETWATTRPRMYIDNRTKRVHNNLIGLQGDIANMEAEGVVWDAPALLDSMNDANMVLSVLKDQNMYVPGSEGKTVKSFRQYAGSGKSLRKDLEKRKAATVAAKKKAKRAVSGRANYFDYKPPQKDPTWVDNLADHMNTRKPRKGKGLLSRMQRGAHPSANRKWLALVSNRGNEYVVGRAGNKDGALRISRRAAKQMGRGFKALARRG